MIDPTSISQSNTILSAIAEVIGSDLNQSEIENFSRQAWLAVVVAHNTNISLFWSRLVTWLLADPTYGVVRYYPEGIKEIEQVSSWD